MSAEAIKRLLSGLHRHCDTISDAYLHNQNTISTISDDTDAAVKALLQQRMVWFLDEDEGVRLSSKLVGLLDSAVRSDRQLHGSNNAAVYWRDLGECLADYKKSHSAHDIEMNRSALQECAAKLIEEIGYAISQFGRFIDRGYAYAESAEIRLQQNARTTERAKELVEMMESCDLSDYKRATGSDRVLRALFYRHLPQAIEEALKNLRRILGDLQHLLTKIREELAMAKMLRGLQNAYEKNPGFEPSEPVMINGVAEVFNIAEPLLLPCAPNIYDRRQEVDLANIVMALGISKRKTDNNVAEGRIEIDNVMNQTEEQPEADPLFVASKECITWLQETGGIGCASEFYKLLGLDTPYDSWLYAFLNYIQSMPKDQRALVDIEFDEVIDPIFTGNRTIFDFSVEVMR